jgi:hypothetical protein
VALQHTHILPPPQWLPSPVLPIKDAYSWHPTTTNYHHGENSNSSGSNNTETNKYNKVVPTHDTAWITMEAVSKPPWTTATTILPEEMIPSASVSESLLGEQQHVSDDNDLWHGSYKKLLLEDESDEQMSTTTLAKKSRLLTERLSTLEDELEEYIRQQRKRLDISGSVVLII